MRSYRFDMSLTGRRRGALPGPPPFSPNSIGFDRAFDFSADNATATATPGAFDTSVGLTWINAPVVREGWGPGNQQMLETSSSDGHVGSMSTGFTAAYSAGLYAFMVVGAISANGSNIARGFADSVSSNNYVAFNGARTGLSVRTQAMGAAVEVPFAAGYNLIGSCNIVELIVSPDGSAQAFVNGVPGLATAPGSITGTFVWNQIGRGTTNSNVNGYWGLTGCKSGGLTVQQRTNFRQWLTDRFWQSTAYHIANEGVATNTGWNVNNAKNALEQVQSTNANPLRLRSGDRVLVKRGDNQIYRLAAPLQLTSVNVPQNIVLDFLSSGSGLPALVTMATRPDDWVSMGGNVWRRTANRPYVDSAVSGSGCIWDGGLAHVAPLATFDPQDNAADFLRWSRDAGQQYLANPEQQRMREQIDDPTDPLPGKYGVSGGDVYVRLADDGDPNDRVWYPDRPATSTQLQPGPVFTISQDNLTILGARVWYGSTTAIDITGEQSHTHMCDVRYFDSDGIDGSGVKTKRMTSCLMIGFGVGKPTGSNGDNSSNHNGDIVRRFSAAFGGDKSTFGDTCQCDGDNQWFLSIGDAGIRVFGNDVTRGTQLYRNGAIVLLDGGLLPHAVDNAGGNLTLQGLTLHGIGSAAGKIGVRNQGGSLGTTGDTVIRDCIITAGLATGLSRTSGSIDENYNAINAATRRTGSIADGANTITAAVNLTDPAALDFRPQAGSPVIGAGVAIAGMTLDLGGVLRPDPPAIGALEAA